VADKNEKTPGITRAFWRDTLSKPKFWGNIALLIIVIVLLFTFTMRIPASVQFTKAHIETVAQHHTDYGTRPVYTATGTDGTYYPLVARSVDMPGELDIGQTVCLRVQKDRFTGRISARHAPENPTCRPNLHTTK